VKRHYLLSNPAERDLRRLPAQVRARIGQALDLLLGEPPRGDVRKLEGRSNEYRLRVGDYRVRFTYIPPPSIDPADPFPPESVLAILVLRIQDRKDAYRD
jgi:mRNA-degrading endonuclease RelE of RelBE toxin-antitoxin system